MLKRMISLILCLAMVLTILPTQTIAQETEEPTEEMLETEPIEEPVEEETEPVDPCADGHDFGEWAVTKEATCGVEGVETRVCKNNAEHKETRSIAATGDHEYVNGECECGAKESYALKFNYKNVNGTWTSSVVTVTVGARINAPEVPSVSGLEHTGWDNNLQDGWTRWYIGMPTEYTATYVESTDDALVDLTVYAYYYVDGEYHHKAKLFVEEFKESKTNNMVPWIYDEGIDAVKAALAAQNGADGYQWDPTVFYNCYDDGEISRWGDLYATGNRDLYVKVNNGKAAEATVLLYVHTAKENAHDRIFAMPGYTTGDFVSYNEALATVKTKYTGSKMEMSDLYDEGDWKDLMDGYKPTGAKTIKIDTNGTTEIHVILTNATNKTGSTEGTCGDDLTWILDAEGTMIISGTGDMYDFLISSVPWHNNMTDIRTVIIEDGVTSMGNFALYGCTNLTRVTLPEGITRIGDFAFNNCKYLTNITLPHSITELGVYVFSGCSKLNSIVIPDGIIDIQMGAFSDCTNLCNIKMPTNLNVIYDYAFEYCSSLTNIELPDTLGKINYAAFDGCSSLSYVTLPKNLAFLGDHAFKNCTNLEQITFLGNAPEFQNDHSPEVTESRVFWYDTATVFYPATNPTWTEDVMQNYGGTLTWVPSDSTATPEPTDPVHPTEPSSPTEPVDPTDPPEPTHPTDSTEPIDPTDPPEPTEPTVENRILLDTAEFSGHSSVWIDGAEMSIQKDGDSWYIDLPDGNARVMTTYDYVTDGTSEDGAAEHVRYPVSMQVWTLENQSGAYTATRQTDFDDILQYSGISIRVTGKKGIRMITSIDAASKESLTGAGLAGYTLREYGTAIAWASQLGSSKPLILGKSWVSSNYAYKKDVADPIFRQTNGLMQYTNVLVDFSNEQCADDLAMRPYMILADADGNEITIYGGIVNRSIGYIALRNRNAFLSDTDPYDFLWDIIHSVYGDAYDVDWQPSWTDAIL